ncbi:MAG: DUF3489 domain-containing protein [Pseudomonadales bacterium]
MSTTQSQRGAEKRISKLDALITKLSGRHGATIEQLTAETGWQRHTVRAALSRLRQRGHRIERTIRKSGASCYRVVKPT